jgi:hypothetical protein
MKKNYLMVKIKESKKLEEKQFERIFPLIFNSRIFIIILNSFDD